MRLLLDSSTLLRDPTRTREATKALERLVAGGRLQLHLSDVIIREVRSNLKEQMEQEVSKLRSALTGIKRRLPPLDTPQSVGELERGVDRALADASNVPVASFDSWLDSMCIVKDPIAGADGQAVMDGYFEGKPPFRESRHRDDIPDAFILESIIRLASVGPLSVVIADGRLRAAAGGLDNLLVYSSLDDLIASDDIQRLLGDVPGAANMTLLARLAPDHNDSITAALNGAHVDVMSGAIISSPEIPGDDNEARILMVGAVRDLRLEWAGAEYYGADRVVIPATFRAGVSANFYISKSEWYAIPDEAAEGIGISDHNEHYFDAEGEYDVVVHGKVSLALGLDLSKRPYEVEAIEDALHDATVALDSIDNLDVTPRRAEL